MLCTLVSGRLGDLNAAKWGRKRVLRYSYRHEKLISSKFACTEEVHQASVYHVRLSSAGAEHWLEWIKLCSKSACGLASVCTLAPLRYCYWTETITRPRDSLTQAEICLPFHDKLVYFRKTLFQMLLVLGMF